MYLGLDIGTSGVKAMLVAEDFGAVGVAHAPLTVSRPHLGWSEQDPDDWITACDAAGTLWLEVAYVVGGGARSDQWLSMLAAATRLTLLRPEAGDFGAAFGAARLAAASVSGDVSARVFSGPAIRSEVAPDTNLAAGHA